MALSFDDIKAGRASFEQIREGIKNGAAPSISGSLAGSSESENKNSMDDVLKQFQSAAARRNQMKGQKTADYVSGKPLLEFPYAAVAGLENFAEGLNSLTQQHAQPPSSVQYASSAIREIMEDSPVKRAFYDLTTSTANMLPAMALSTMTGGGGLGALLTGVSSGGNAKMQALQDGYSNEEALLYGAVNGALEGGLQYALGGINKLGKGGISKLVSKAPAIKAIGKAAQSAIKSPVIKNALKASGKYIANMGDEAFEEYLQSVLDPVVRNVILKEDNEIDLLSEDALYSALLGALSAGLLNLPGAVSEIRTGISSRSGNQTVDADGTQSLGNTENVDNSANSNLPPIDSGNESINGPTVGSPVKDNPAKYVQTDLSPEAKSNRASVVRETGTALNINPDIVDTVAKVAENTGRNIQFVDTLGEGINGKYDAQTGTLYIAADSPNPEKTVLKHELTHSLEGTKAYEDLRDYLLSEALAKDAENAGIQLDDVIQAKITQYERAGETLSRDAAVKELIADYVGDNLFTSEQAIRQLSASKPSLARRILNWIRSIKTALFGTKQEKILTRAENLYHDALMEPYRQSDNVQHSIGYTTDNKPVVIVEENILDGVPRAEWVKKVKQTISGKFSGGIPVSGRLVKVNKTTKNEYTNSKNTQYYGKNVESKYSDKFKSANNLDEIVLASTNYVNEDLKHERKDNFKEFARGDVLIRVGDKDYKAKVIVGFTTGNQMVLYDVIDFVPQSFTLKTKGTGSSVTQMQSLARTDSTVPSFDTTVPQDTDRVNASVFERGEEYSIKKEDTSQYTVQSYKTKNSRADVSSSDNTVPQSTDAVNTSISENIQNDTGKVALKTKALDSDGAALTEWQEQHFKDSQVRDKDGRLQVVYHATEADFTVFDKARQGSANDPGVWGSGFYFDTDREMAEQFGSKSRPFYLNITNPLRTTYDADCHVVAGIFRRAGIDIPFKIKPDTSLLQFIKKFGNRKFSDTLQRLGYDGIIVSGEECVVYEPEQAKLTSNKNPSDDPDMRRSIGISSGDTMADWKALVEKYGAIKPGEAPARDIQVPKRTSDDTRTRQFVRTALESSQVPDGFVGGITQDIMNDVYHYVPVSNNEAMKRAVSTVEDMGMDQAVKQWEAAVNGKRGPDKNDMALGEYLLTLAGKNNEPALASKMIVELASVGTNAGQVIQAMSMLKRMTPEGRLLALQRVADRINRERPDSHVKVPESVIEKIQKTNPRDAEAMDNAVQEGLVSLAEQVPATWLDKWNAWRYLAMLGNPRTHVRNVVGNAVFTPVIYIKNALAGTIEGAVDYASKAAGGKGIARTKTALAALPFTQYQLYLDFARQDYQSIKPYLEGSGNRNPADIVRDNQTIFRLKPLETARKGNSAAMQSEDMAFKRVHYMRALMQYMAANKVDVSNVDAETLQRGRNYAIREAQKATFADESAIANALSRFARTNKAAQFIVEGTLPFKKTPINILKRSIEYSPGGLLDTVTRKAYQLKKGNISAAEFIDSLAAGLTGTGIMALGMWLQSIGVLAGGMGDDREDEFEQLQGKQEYAIQIGDTSYTIDWASPVVLPLLVGAEIEKLRTSSKEGEIPFAKMLEAVTNLTEPVVNMSMLQGINDSIENVKFSENPLTDMALNAGASYISQGVPTLLGQIARTSDDKRRRNYVEQGSAFSSLQYAAQRSKSKIPGALQTQQPYVDAWGREEPTGEWWERAFNNFISPGYTSKTQTSDMEKELQRLYRETGESSVLPASAGKSVTNKGEKYVLTAEEYTAYQREMGKKSYDMITELTKSTGYGALTDEQKSKAVTMIYSYARESAKEAFMKVRGIRYEASSDKTNIEDAVRNGVSMADYVSYEAATKDVKADKDRNGNTISGSKKKKLEAIIDQMGLTRQQKKVLLALDGYGSDKERERILSGKANNTSSTQEIDIDRLWREAIS